MLEQLTPELRQELAATRFAGLHRSADHTPLDSIATRSARTIRRDTAEPRHADTVVGARGT
jgi:hypothetical protein